MPRFANIIAVSASAALAAWGMAAQAKAAPACPPAPQLQACFTPGQDCEAQIVSVIDTARQEVLLQTYKFTSKPIIDALSRAKGRGVRVRMVLDDSLEQKKTFQRLEGGGFDIRLDDAVKTAHNKVIVTDGTTVITGSFNFTHGAEAKNAENIIIVRNSPDIARAYAGNWQSRYDASRPAH